ncbi:MAG: hypothetical protein V3U19_09415, partial [Thermodesulfobacteriota bacterium]
DSDGTGVGSYEFTHALVSGANSRVAFMSANLSGATAGNRGGKLDFRTKADGSSTINSHLIIDDTGKMTANVSGLSSGDFEVKAQTSGTAMYVDVSTSSVGIGTSSPSIAGFGRVLTIVEAADTNNGKVELHRVTNDSDGIGLGSYEFTHALVSGANSRVAFMSANLSGATAGNRGGKLDFRTKANGSSTINSHMTIDDTGKITTNASALSTGDFEVLAQTTGTAIYADVSTGNTIFGQGVTGSRTVEMHGGNGASAELIIHGNSGGLGSNQDTSIRFKSGSLTRWRMGVDEGTTDDPFVIDPSGSLSGTAFSISRASGNPAKFGGNLTVNGGRIDCLNTASSPASVTIDSLNRASSLSIISRSSGGGSGRDAYMRFRIGTGDHFYIGMDDNDSGILKISGNGYFGSEDFMTFDQSTFKTVLNASASATGDVEILQSGGGQLALFDAGTGEIFLNLPTSAGTTGSLYNDSGTVKVA